MTTIQVRLNFLDLLDARHTGADAWCILQKCPHGLYRGIDS